MSRTLTLTLTCCWSPLVSTLSWGFLFFLPGPLIPAHLPTILRA